MGQGKEIDFSSSKIKKGEGGRKGEKQPSMFQILFRMFDISPM